MQDIKTISVTYEGPAVRCGGGWSHPSSVSLLCIADGLEGASVEIIEPPFSVGDAVRSDDGTVWARMPGAWVTHGQPITYDDSVVRRWLNAGDVVQLYPAGQPEVKS